MKWIFLVWAWFGLLSGFLDPSKKPYWLGVHIFSLAVYSFLYQLDKESQP